MFGTEPTEKQYLSTAGRDRPKGGDVEDAINRVHALANRLEAAGSSLTQLSLRLFVGENVTGANAGLGGNNSAAPARSGQVGALADALDRLELVVGGMQDHANNLQRL